MQRPLLALTAGTPTGADWHPLASACCCSGITKLSITTITHMIPIAATMAIIAKVVS
jgi:hypothetical protein